ncbi:unnamed protein product [Heterobilharzia americana]|nr:unnamed protein product [Heterobilharzia americana]
MLFRLLFFIAFISKSISVDFIKFQKLSIASEESLIFLSNDKPTVTLDASVNQQRTVYFAQRSTVMNLKLTIACIVNHQVKPLEKVSLCCRKSMDDPKRSCNRISKVEGKFSCMNTDFQYSMDEYAGANFSISLTRDTAMSNPISGFFSCVVATDDFNIIESNEIEVRDAVYYIRQLRHTLSGKVDVVPPIPLPLFPYEFRCSDDTNVILGWPYWMHQLDGRYGPYRWRYCLAAGSLNAVTCAERTVEFSTDAIVTFINGSAYLTDPNLIDTKSIAVVCTHVDYVGPVKTFAGKVGGHEVSEIAAGLSLDKTVTEPGDSKLYPLTALSSSYIISKGSKLQDFYLKALYRQPEGAYVYHWFKDDQLLPEKSSKKYSYPLPSRVDESVSGTYALVVKSETDVTDRLVFTYDIKVVAPPVFKDLKCLKELFYVMEGNSFNAICEFDSRWDTEVYVGVSSFEATSSQQLRRSVEENFKYSRQQLSQLDIDFHVDDEGMNKKITVAITNLKLEQDCDLFIRIASRYGQGRVSTAIKVVPKPQLTMSPSNENCIKECDEKPYNVSCGLNENIVQDWKLKFNIEPSVDWIIQNQWTRTHLEPNGLGKFITVNDGHDSVLTVWPEGKPSPVMDQHEQDENEEVEKGEEESRNSKINGEPVQIPSTTLKQFLAQKMSDSEAQPPKDLILSCWIRLTVIEREAEFEKPGGLALHQPVAREAQLVQPTGTNRLIYDSRWETDTNLVKQLTATRTFTPDLIPASAGLAWIAAVIIGVIILIVVIGLSIWLCTRDRGETYMVYDKERAHGHDPIQELKEKETFQTFQRLEEPRIAASRYSLNDGSVRFESEDDGELDEYAGGPVTHPLLTNTQQESHHTESNHKL